MRIRAAVINYMENPGLTPIASLRHRVAVNGASGEARSSSKSNCWAIPFRSIDDQRRPSPEMPSCSARSRREVVNLGPVTTSRRRSVILSSADCDIAAGAEGRPALRAWINSNGARHALTGATAPRAARSRLHRHIASRIREYAVVHARARSNRRELGLRGAALFGCAVITGAWRSSTRKVQAAHCGFSGSRRRLRRICRQARRCRHVIA